MSVDAILQANRILAAAGLPTYSHLVEVITEASSLFDNYPELNEMVGTRELIDAVLDDAVTVKVEADRVQSMTTELSAPDEAVLQKVIHLLRQQWYDLNNQPRGEDEDARTIGRRSGAKSAVISSINLVRQHFNID